MNKNLLKIGALTLGMFVFGLMYYTNAQGTVSLTINSWTSTCTLWSNVTMAAVEVTDLLTSNVLTTWTFDTPTWQCTDYDADPAGWSVDVVSTNLTATGGYSIPAENISIQYSTGNHVGSTDCSIGSATTRTAINTAQTVLRRAGTDVATCQVAANNVKIQVDVPQYQAPGSYTATLTITNTL